MKIPIKWLKEYLRTNKSDKEIAEILTMSGTEVEKIESHGASWNGVSVAEVLEIEKHPNADRLNLVTVNTGKGKQTVVCGAPNVAVGQKICFAHEGAKLGDFELKRITIRGVESSGMCCSGAELGLSDDHGGILVLNTAAKIGDPIKEALEIGETVLEAEITPNRSDEFSMFGIAREVSAVTGDKLVFPEINLNELNDAADKLIKISIEDKDLCPQYLARVVEIEKVGQSPLWMKKHLEAAGVRPKNVVVDITNYVMLELGQPLHAFDAAKIEDKTMIVRKAIKEESIKTLDGEERKLSSNVLIIADNKRPIAIAGIMGGEGTEISENTTRIILESATFDKVSVRKTSDKMGLRTEAVVRFEKGLPLRLAEMAVDRAAYFLQELAGGKVYKGIVSQENIKEKEVEINFPEIWIKQKLGIIIPTNEALDILNRLGFKAQSSDGRIWTKVPWWRLDISIPEDLLEEIVRIYGLNSIVSSLPSGEMPRLKISKEQQLEFYVRDLFEGIGFFEVINYSFISEKMVKGAGFESDKLIRIVNPISSDLEYMRPSLIPSILDVIAKNERSNACVKIYELGKTYAPTKNMPHEEKRLILAVSGPDNEKMIYHTGKSFYLAKGAVEIIFAKLGIKADFFQEEVDNFHPGRAAKIMVDENILGFIGEIHPDLARSFGLKREAAIIDIDFKELVKKANFVRQYVPISKYPLVERDLSFIVDEKITFKEIVENLKKTSKILNKVELLDIYAGLGQQGKVSKTVRLFYCPTETTLSEKDINLLTKKAIEVLEEKFGAVVRV